MKIDSEQFCSVKYVVDQPNMYKLPKKHMAVTLSHAIHLLHLVLAPIPWHRMTIVSTHASKGNTQMSTFSLMNILNSHFQPLIMAENHKWRNPPTVTS